MCQVNGPSYSVQCDKCGKSMRNTDDICPHCKHNYAEGVSTPTSEAPETSAVLSGKHEFQYPTPSPTATIEGQKEG